MPPYQAKEGEFHSDTKLATVTSQVDTTQPEDDAQVLIVGWDSEHDTKNPKNWSYSQKWVATGLISIFTMLSPITSSMIAPAAPQVARELGGHGPVFQPLLTSIYILAYAFGPLFFGPLSQILGRARVVQSGNLFYLGFNFACAYARTPSQILAFRFLAGLGGSAPLAIGGGVINDCWSVEQRGRAVTLYALAPLLGPIIGPVAGAWISFRTTWKWVFWSTSIAVLVIQVIALLWLKETCAPVLLARKAKRIRKSLPTGSNQKVITTVQLDRIGKPSIAKQLLYPITILFTEPIAQLLGIYVAYLYGLVYLLLIAINVLFVDVYHENVGIAGLHYIAFGLGLYIGAQISNFGLDRIYKALAARKKTKGRPEFRLPIMVPATFAVPIGLLITGWTSQNRVFWLVPDIGLFITGVGIAINYQTIQTYIIDTYTVRAAPALGGLSLLRSLVGFALPLCAPSMYSHLGYGVGDTVLAACSIGLGFPMLVILWFFGSNLRQRSPTALHDSD